MLNTFADWSREGSYPPGHGGHNKCPVGLVGKTAQQARVAASSRHGTGTAGLHHRLPVHHGRHHQRGSHRAAEEGEGGQGGEGGEAAEVRIPRLHHPSWLVVVHKWMIKVWIVLVSVAGWIGYSNETLTELCEKYLELGFTSFKLKVGKDFHDDVRRLQAVRNVIGWENKLVSPKVNV